jgi:membrane protein
VKIGRWPFLALLVLCLLSLLYRYGPCRRVAKWHLVTVGSLFATTVWLLASAVFSYYNFAHYDRFYGSLGAVIIFLFWLYISFYIVLLGAEINAELELQTAMDTTSDPAAVSEAPSSPTTSPAVRTTTNVRPVRSWRATR